MGHTVNKCIMSISNSGRNLLYEFSLFDDIICHLVFVSLLISLIFNSGLLYIFSNRLDQNLVRKIASALAQVHLVPYSTFSTYICPVSSGYDIVKLHSLSAAYNYTVNVPSKSCAINMTCKDR